MTDSPLFFSLRGALVWSHYGVIVDAETVRGAGFVRLISKDNREKLDDKDTPKYRGRSVELAPKPRSYDGAAQAGMVKGLMSRLDRLEQAHLVAKFLHGAAQSAAIEATERAKERSGVAQAWADAVRVRAKREQSENEKRAAEQRRIAEMEATEAERLARTLKDRARRERSAMTARHRAAITLLARHARREVAIPWLKLSLARALVELHYGRKVELQTLIEKHDVGRHRLDGARRQLHDVLETIARKAEERAYAYFYDGGLVA